MTQEAAKKVIRVEGTENGASASASATPTTAQPTGTLTLDASAPAPAARAMAAPANDECAGAVAIPDGPYPVLTAPQDISEATPQGAHSGELTCAPMDNTVWYSFTPSVTAAYTFDTCRNAGATGSTVYDTIIGVLESTGGACPGATELGCSDSPAVPGCGFPSTAPGFPYIDQGIVDAVLTAGTTYFVVAGHWADDDPVAAPFNEIQINVTRSNAPGNDTCAGVVALELNRVTVGTTVGAEDDYQSPSSAACFSGVGQTLTTSPGRDVVYSFTAPAAGNYSVRWVTDAPAPALRSQNPTLYASSTCPAGGTVSCLLGANRMLPATGQNKGEELYCMALAANQTIYVFFDDGAAGNNGGPHDIEVTPCRRETEPNDSIATATPYSACFMEGTTFPGGAGGDIDFFNLGTYPVGSKVFAAIDGVQPNNADWAMRVTNTTDTLQFDDNDGASIIGSNSPVISGTPTTGGDTYVRLNHNVAGGAEPYHLYARVETGPAQPEVEPNNPAPNSLSYFASTLMTGGGYIRGTATADTDLDCYRFLQYEGDDIVFFGGGNPDRVPGATLDTWPLMFDLAGSGFNLQAFGGQILRNILTPSPGNLAGTTPSIVSNFWSHRAKYTGANLVCMTPLQPVGAGYPLPWHGSISRDCGPLPVPTAQVTDLVVTKTAPAIVQTSGIFDYTVEIANPSATDIAADVRILDNLPDNLTLVAVLVDDGFGGNNVDCEQLDEDLINCINYSIAPGTSTTYTFRVQVAQCLGAGVVLSNTATVTTVASDPNLANNTSSVDVTTEEGPCSDSNPCTDDACVSGTCVGTADDTNTCDDSNVCTDDACGSGACVATPNTSPCDDTLFCTVDDICADGACSGAPNPCGDGDPCTNDQCDENEGCFNAFEVGALCDDGNPCTAVDFCFNEPTEGCYGFKETICEPDGLNCTTDTCDENAACIYVPADCSDGDECTANSCDEATGCVSSPVVCDDGSACTADSCDSGTGCVYAPINCDDGSVCTDDSCDEATGCVNSEIVCDDGDPCTADSCDAGSGCVFTPIPDCGSVCTSTDSPKNLAFWKKQCNGHGQGGDPITLADVACVASQGDLFASVDEVKDICDVLAGDVGISNSCSAANAQLMALALNICHERVCDSTSIDSRYSDNTTVGESYDEADDLLSAPTGSGCQLSKNLASEINGGRAVSGSSSDTQDTTIESGDPRLRTIQDR